MVIYISYKRFRKLSYESTFGYLGVSQNKAEDFQSLVLYDPLTISLRNKPIHIHGYGIMDINNTKRKREEQDQ